MAFLQRKWKKELDYRLAKSCATFRESACQYGFAYEWHNDSGIGFRSYGSERRWEFDEMA